MREKNYYLRVIIILLAILVTSVILKYYYSLRYKTIKVNQFSYLIPSKMCDDSKIYSSDHMFKIVDNNGKYQVYGTILNDYNEEDEILGCFNADIEIDSLLKSNNRNEIGKIIANNSNLFSENTLFKGGQDHFARYFRYYYIGKGESLFQDYNTLVFYCKMYDMVSVEVFIYKDSSMISLGDINEMFGSFEFDIP